jgi:hypothetical protein
VFIIHKKIKENACLLDESNVDEVRHASVTLCGQWSLMNSNGIFYRSILRPAMLDDIEHCTSKK